MSSVHSTPQIDKSNKNCDEVVESIYYNKNKTATTSWWGNTNWFKNQKTVEKEEEKKTGGAKVFNRFRPLEENIQQQQQEEGMTMIQGNKNKKNFNQFINH